MKILAVDTSASAGSCALLSNGVLIGEFFINVPITHSQTILPMISALLTQCNMKISDIDLFAVSCGPGSFTGLRIGISLVKGLALPQNIPCVGVSTLEALAENLSDFDGFILPVMDARREQVYTAQFSASGGELKRITEDCAISIAELGNQISKLGEKSVILVGDGAELCYNSLEKRQNLFIAPIQRRFQRAASIAVIAERLASLGKTSGAEDLKPCYLRLPQAERELIEKSERDDTR